MADLGKAYVQIIPKADGITEKLKSTVSPGAGAAGKSAGTSFASNLKGMLVKAGIGTAVAATMKAALDEGGKLQQSYGGLDTLYGDASAAAKQYAEQAAQAGISANSYAEQAVSFGASLKAAFGGDTAKAAEAANTAIMDMADNSAKMGTDLSSVQAAYQGFAKGQYQLLDNLKLGYGGTKSEMERLLADATKISGVEYDMDNLGDVYSAIHVIQGELGLTGVAAEEAKTTFTGSFGAMKASAQNVLAMMSTGGDVGPAIQQLATSAGTFLFDNLIPMVGNVIGQIPTIVATFIQSGGPQFLASGMELVTGLVGGITAALPQMATSAANALTSFANGFASGSEGAANLFAKAGEMMTGLGTALLEAAGIIIPALINSIYTIITTTDWIGLGTTVVTTLMSGLEATFPKAIEVVDGAVKEIINLLGFSGLSTKVESLFKTVKDKITEPIDSAKELVSSAVEKIKGLFPISMGKIFSGIQLPHFKISGGSVPWGIGGAGTPPSVDIEWYKRGGIMTKPTLFGGGEAGHEGIVPLDPFWDRLDRMADSIVNGVATVAAGAASGGDVYVTLYAYPGGPQMDEQIVRSYDRGKRNGLK